MLIATLPNSNPYVNIATEEYLLKSSQQEYFIIYQNTPCVVVGKHQNTLEEMNAEYMEQNGILPARRISGGGAVYHDMGNVNFSFIRNGKPDNLVNFKAHTAPIIAFLKGLGVNAKFCSNNSICIGSKKISGNAEHIFKGRVLHHGTLLLNTDLNHLAHSLYVPSRYQSKGVRSKRADVTNISTHIEGTISTEYFIERLAEYIHKQNADSLHYDLSESESNAIQQLANSKYSTWEWIYGYSPSYSYSREVNINGETVPVSIKVDKGIISEVTILRDTPHAALLWTLEGCRHSKTAMFKRLMKELRQEKATIKLTSDLL